METAYVHCGFQMCTKFRKILVPHLDERIAEAIAKGSMTAKTHPGRVKVGTSTLPEELVETIRKVLQGRVLFSNYTIMHVQSTVSISFSVEFLCL